MKQLHNLTYLLTLLVIGFTPLDAIEISQGSGITLGRYFFIIMTASAIFSGDIILKKIPTFFNVLIIFTLWAFFTVIWSINPDTTVERIFYLIQYSIIVIVMLNTLNRQRNLKMAMIAWIFGSVYIAYKTATDFSSVTIQTDELYRVNLFGNPNENSFMLCYSLIFCYLIDKTRFRLPSITLTAFAAYAIIANGSRMGIILYLIAVSAFCVQLWQNKKRWYITILIPAMIMFGIHVLNNIPEATLMRILGIAENIGQGNLSQRENIWAAAANMLSHHSVWIILGCGWGSFSYAIQRLIGYNIGAHNFYLDVWFTTGFIGFSIVIIYFIRLFNIIRQTYKATIMNYLLLGLPLISMMSTNWQSRRWWFLMGAFIYLIYKTNNFSNCNETTRAYK